jgi:EamA-like transporter family
VCGSFTASTAPLSPAVAVALAAAILLMGSSFIAGKILLCDEFPPLLLAGWRFLFAALFTLPLVLINSRFCLSVIAPPRFGLQNSATVGVIGLLETTAAMGLLYLAQLRISATTAAVLPVHESHLGDERPLQGRSLSFLLRLAGIALAISVSPDRPWARTEPSAT